jgi:cytochrome c oxidase subunit II
LQHAHMAFDVVVHPVPEYRAWLAQQLEPAATPEDALARHGQQTFLRSACPLCHAITGTPAFGTVGPDLTHVASRRTLAAGTLPNDRANLERWIANPQAFKPGTRMPVVELSEDERTAIVAYLASLK